MEFPSSLIEKAINEISKLPGIGKKTALRLALHLLKKDETQSEQLAKAILDMRANIIYCSVCNNISDSEVCNICLSPRRDKSIICVVEDIRDVIAVENTGQYQGTYHVLGGIISPVEGIGPDELNIGSLLSRTSSNDPKINEIIFALSPTMEGDTTAFYISKKIHDSDIKITSIARGIPIGGDLEYADEITLGRSIMSRTSYDRN